MQQQEGEERSRPLPAQGNLTAVFHNGQRSENAEFNGNVAFVALVSFRG